MQFLVRTQFTRPADLSDADILDLLERERVRSVQLQNAGTIRHLWREPGTTIAWGIWDVADFPALSSVINSLPCHAHMDVRIREVVDHPNLTTPTLRSQT